MRKIVNFLFIKLRGKTISNEIEMRYLIEFLIQKFNMLIRGILKGVFINKKGIIFIGKKVNIRCKKNILIGKNVVFNNYVKIDALAQEKVIIGDNASIGESTSIMCTGSFENIGKGLIIGNNFSCGYECFFGCAGGVKIGDDVIMGQNVRIHSENHNYSDINIPIRLQGVNRKGVTIGSDCWIGAGAVILDGVEIGDGCIIGANTVVTKSIDDFSVLVGNPGRVLKKRIGA